MSAPEPRLSPEQLRQKLHDGLCQQLAGGALLQAVFIKRLETAADADEKFASMVADARNVEELLRQALEEARSVMREIG